ncbi:hypothetical protein BCR43DRAFT_494925 [Syncephalastrum racemosum]|uniref:Uncharacterized protein n=1 Tax=Syncephalastrum racemosum TaxID=13706 RepID=A0A1X2H8U3_SYNRA|nr:hypothetical protein BCR43DRAFT_494925 [Syncephalastrum racemosum]
MLESPPPARAQYGHYYPGQLSHDARWSLQSEATSFSPRNSQYYYNPHQSSPGLPYMSPTQNSQQAEEWRVSSKESWKVASAYNNNNSSSSVNYNEPSVMPEEHYYSPASKHPSKPLPQEPPMPPPRHSGVFATAVECYDPQQPTSYYYYSDQLPLEPTPDDSTYVNDYHNYDGYNDYDHDYCYPPSWSPDSPSMVSTPPEEPVAKKSEPVTSNERKTRQITVQSINREHRVWIDVEPTETGISLAEKIHTIATFRTRKILTITTKSGRVVPIDHRPVFGSWMDMEAFQDGEQWKVEWGQLDKGFMDRIFSKVIQVGSGRRRDASK